MTLRPALCTLVTAAALLIASPAPAGAAISPDPADLRHLNCDSGQVDAFLSPAGFGSPFHVVGSNEVILPLYVEVTVDGETFVTIDRLDIDTSAAWVEHCSYTDPFGLFVEFWGVRTTPRQLEPHRPLGH